MDDIKVILASPSHWLLALGVAAILGVWWAKMTPTTANLTLAIGVAAIAGSVFLNPWVASQPRLVRLLWTITTFSALSLAAYYTLWTKFFPLVMHVTTSAATQPPGLTIGGVPWGGHYTEVRLFVANDSRMDYRDIDLVVRPDTAVAAAGQVSSLSGVSLWFDSQPPITPEWVDEQTGRREAMPMEPLASTLGFRVRCDLLPRGSHLEIVLAAVIVNDTPTNQDPDRLIRVAFKPGEFFWFAKPRHSNRVFSQKPAVATVAVTGHYMANDRLISVSEVLPAHDHLRDAIQNLKRPK